MSNLCHQSALKECKSWGQFVLESKTYLLLVGYLSRYVHIAQLSHTSSTDVIVHLKYIFTHHGNPEVLILDNKPQFSVQAVTSA